MTTFKIVNFTGGLRECECCGSYSAESETVYVNDVAVWENYSDGHMYSNTTPEPIQECIIKAWFDESKKRVEANYTEEARLAWNLNYPGNSVAASTGSWLREKICALEFLSSELSELTQVCTNLPSQTVLLVKMIALWIESISGENINVDTADEYETDDFDSDD